MRALLTSVHRWAGLVLAGFLILAGLTGSSLAWLDEIELALNPEFHLVQAPGPDALPLDPLVLREQVAQRYPGAEASTVWLTVKPGRGHAFSLVGKADSFGRHVEELPNDQIFFNPYTAEVLGERRWGDITQGPKNLMPFIYRLHYSLALDRLGQYLLGIVALLWTLDCFIGACLTFPPRTRHAPTGRSWFTRWKPAWRLRRGSGGYRLNYDLHRAGGLWTWAMLFVLAWSSVAFNLVEVYNPVTRALLSTQFDPRDIPSGTHKPEPPAQGWFKARETARKLMAEQARIHGFTVHGEDWMAYDASRRLYRYDVSSSRDVNRHKGDTRVHFDADTGELRGVWLPTGAANGDTITTWIMSLHMAALWGLPIKLFVCAMGLVVAMLSVTGVYIWWKKRQARQKSLLVRLRPSRPTPPEAQTIR